MEFIISSILKVPPLTLFCSDSPKLTINDQRPASQPAASSRRRRRQSKKLNYQRINKISTINFISICLKVTHKMARFAKYAKNQQKIAYNSLKLLQTKLHNLQTSQNSVKELKTSKKLTLKSSKFAKYASKYTTNFAKKTYKPRIIHINNIKQVSLYPPYKAEMLPFLIIMLKPLNLLHSLLNSLSPSNSHSYDRTKL
jgi:hypothetical protein